MKETASRNRSNGNTDKWQLPVTQQSLRLLLGHWQMRRTRIVQDHRCRELQCDRRDESGGSDGEM